jgi:mRNA-degrading endonuclease toxin of MazEF toxin-antitoxin module
VPERGEVWQVDFGITQKVRPALIIRFPYAEIDRALLEVIPHTTRLTSHRGVGPSGFCSEGDSSERPEADL